MKRWRKRWFVLKDNGYLYYYEGNSSTKEKARIDVLGAGKVGEWKAISSASRNIPSGLLSINAFAIVTGDRTLTCVCEKRGESQ